jgi:hypothetical protein
MKKLEDIPKKEIFQVPDGYFEALPGILQSRIANKKSAQETSFFIRYRMALGYSLSVVFILIASIFWYTRTAQSTDAESILAAVNTEALISYLEESDVTMEDLLQNIEFTGNDLEDIENEVYFPFDDLNFEGIGTEIALDTL